MNFQLADDRHDQALRDLLRSAPMPGWVRLAFGRDPDFFQAASIQGFLNQTLIAVEDDRVGGMGCRSLKNVFINGRKEVVGYLSGLRLNPDLRGSTTLARGYAALRRLHEQHPVPFYLTTIVEDNGKAKSVLTSGRAGLPRYLDCGRYLTYAVALGPRRPKFNGSVEVARGNGAGVDELLGFFEEVGSQRQFFPALSRNDFGSPLLRGLRPENFYVARNKDGKITGAAAAWDQDSFKQVLVKDYAPSIRALRPALNIWRRLIGHRPLPAPGQSLRSLYIAFACIRNDDPLVFRAILETVYADFRDRSFDFLAIGMHENDPLNAALRHFPSFRYVSRCYIVHWEDGEHCVKGLESDRIPYLELATL